MIFCHYCYEEIIDETCITANDYKEYYHIDCFAEMNNVELI
jgi:hypothetical protein